MRKSLAFVSLIALLLVLAGSTHAAPPLPRPGLAGNCVLVLPTGGDDTASIRAALTEAEAQPAHCLRFGPYTYNISGTQGTLFDVHADRMDIAGTPQTVLTFPPAATLTGELWVWRLWGQAQQIGVMQIGGAQTWGGTGFWGAVSVYDGADRPHIYDLDITRIWGAGGAGGTGIALYQPWSTANGAQYALVEHNYIHDGAGQGIGINASNNQIVGNRIERMGVNTFQHCVYLQGGYNVLRDNTFLRCGSFNIHAYFDVEHLDASGNLITGNYSENPGEGHIWAQNYAPEDGTNPRLPAGSQTSRFITISDNTFVDRDGSTAYGIISYVPSLITGNSFEDVQRGDAGAVTIAPEAAGSVVSGNRIGWVLERSGGPQITIRGAGSVVSGNSSAVAASQQAVVVQAPNVQVSGNTMQLQGAGSEGIRVAADGARLDGNTITAEPGAGAGVHWQGAPQAADVSGNRITTSGATWTLYWDDPAHSGARVHHNGLWGRLDQSGPGLLFGENDP